MITFLFAEKEEYEDFLLIRKMQGSKKLIEKKICAVVFMGILMCLCACGRTVENDLPQKEEPRQVIGEELKKDVSGRPSLHTETAEIIIGERTVQEHVKNMEETERQKQRDAELGEILNKSVEYLKEQVPEIFDEWAGYVLDKSEGRAHICVILFSELEPEDVYRDHERTEYLGKYYLIYIGESWEDHRALWSYFYVSENFDEVLWYDIAMTEKYPVLYLDEWRESDRYPELE